MIVNARRLELRLRTAVVLAAVALIAAACGSGTDTAAGAGETSVPAQCVDSSSIAELLVSGSPVFDYEPAPDIASLIDQTDLLVTGTLESAVRVDSPEAATTIGGEQLTRVAVANAVLLGEVGEGVRIDFELTRSFALQSSWTQDDDPLGEPVLFDSTRTQFIAFLNSSGLQSDPWLVPPQGLHVWCVGDTEVQSVIDSVPLNSTFAPGEFELAVSEALIPTS